MPRLSWITIGLNSAHSNRRGQVVREGHVIEEWLINVLDWDRTVALERRDELVAGMWSTTWRRRASIA